MNKQASYKAGDPQVSGFGRAPQLPCFVSRCLGDDVTWQDYVELLYPLREVRRFPVTIWRLLSGRLL